MALGAQLNAHFGATASITLLGDVNAAVSAAGTTLATATALTYAISIVTTCAAGAGVRLPVTPTVSARDRLTVANHTVNTCAVYPSSGGKLGTASIGAPALLAPGKAADFVCTDGTNYATLLGA